MAKPQLATFNFPRTKQEMPVGPNSTAGVITESNAGWRTFRPLIDGQKCVKCQKCWLICPDGVIDRTTTPYQIDYNFCKGCGICAYECPTKAISMVKEGEHVD